MLLIFVTHLVASKIMSKVYDFNAGYLFCQSKARILIFISTAYSLYSVFVSVGWSGIILLTNLSFLSNDLLSMFLQECDHAHENGQREEPQKSTPDDISPKDGFCSPESEAMKVDSGIISEELDGGNTKDTEKHATLSDEKKSDSRSLDEIRRIMDSSSHYEALGFPRYKNIDSTALKKEYKRMVANVTFFCFTMFVIIWRHISQVYFYYWVPFNFFICYLSIKHCSVTLVQLLKS